MSELNLAIFAVWMAFWVYWYISARRTRSATKRRVSLWLEWILYSLGYIVLFGNLATFGPLASRFLPDTIAVGLIGLVIMFAGLSFAFWARMRLGQYWSGGVSIKVDHKLIRTGPYRLVRHPIYAGVLFGFVGTGIAVGEIRAWLAFALALTAVLIKIQAEEKLMMEEFGPTYLQYKREVKMLIPFVV